ncbi:MAG TPA: ABC transporter substrate-binding protein [Candidatus Dormibacteraeota bacterium]|nr:ABC transporter substrate-binding protein [Candidatus Dormibacteraeota bacterium]
MPKRFLVTIALGSTLLISACGGGSSSNTSNPCGSDAAKPSSTTAPPPSGELTTPGTLTFGSDVSYPPQEFYPDGCPKTADGFDLDLAKAVAARMGLKYAVVDTKFDGIIPALQTKKFDALISAMTITDDRKKVLQFEPYFTAGESFIVLSSSSKNPQELKDLCGLKVAVEKGTTEESDATDANDAAKSGVCAKNPIDFKGTDFDKDTQSLEALRKGTADVHFTDSPVASYELLKNTGLKVTNKAIVSTAPEGVAVRKDDTAMFTALDKAFKAIMADGTYKTLLAKWKLEPGDITKTPS